MSDKSLLKEIEKFKKWKKGKTWIAGKLGVALEDVEKLMEIIVDDEDDALVENGPVLTDEEVDLESGDKELKFFSERPLYKEEIEALYGIDGITSRLTNYWNKKQANGKYLISAHVKCLINDFYTKDDLQERLKVIFPQDLIALTLPECTDAQEKLLTIMISDDHAGMVNSTNLFNNEEFTEEVYKQRLLNIVGEAIKLGMKFEEVRVISLGDQLQGWNKQTTRGGHEVNATSNRDQFDFYTRARAAFYDALFSSGIGVTYHVDEIDTSNHSGLGFSYMANKFLSMYLEAKFPQVIHTQYAASIDGIQFGKHVLILTHGKEEKFQKRPFPYNVDDRTDLYVYDWISTMGYNPTEVFVTLYKGDLHKFGLQMCKFGRYVNIPSVSGRSDYSDNNFGNSRPGAVLEIYEKNTDLITTKPIWF